MAPVRRYRRVGGVAAWRVPVLVLAATAIAIAGGEIAVTCVLLGAGLAARALERARVVEVSPGGLASGFVLSGALVGAPPVVPWAAVTAIVTGWRGGRDGSVLETVVRARDGAAIRFTSGMGVRAYQTLLVDVARCAPRAARLGLTAQALAEAGAPVFRLPAGWMSAVPVTLVVILLALAAWL